MTDTVVKDRLDDRQTDKKCHKITWKELTPSKSLASVKSPEARTTEGWTEKIIFHFKHIIEKFNNEIELRKHNNMKRDNFVTLDIFSMRM